MNILHLAAFLSSFLLFQVELIMAKKLLPVYGGSFFVWGACVVFYQAVLLLGYGFTEVGVTKLGMDRYRWVHVVVLGLPLLGFPGHALPLLAEAGKLPLTLSVFWQLLRTIGPAFFALSTV